MKGGPLSAWTCQMLLFKFFSHMPLHMLRDWCLAVYLVVSAIPLACVTQCYWMVLACMNASDLATICKCDRLIRFKIDGSTMRTHLTFVIKPTFSVHKLIPKNSPMTSLYTNWSLYITFTMIFYMSQE